ncbi:MAG: hypothetical protein GQE15_37015 [Archangiaceae bacterium]|nr:hypothetical protein [Archangiaceae bacterium]
MRTTLLMLVLLVARLAFADAPTVAILYFDYDGTDGELVPLRKGLAQMLITDLAGRDSYRVVERARLQEVLAELDLGKTQKLDPAAALKVGKLLQAKYMVVGGYFAMGGTLRIDARVFEVESTNTLKGFGATGKSDDFFALEQKVAADADGVLLAAIAKGAAAPPPKPTPPTAIAKSGKGKVPLKAVSALSKALQSKDDQDAARAKAQLEEVVKANPDFLLARLELADLSR